jgi:hypothetical protein
MNSILDNLGKFEEYMIEYDNENLVVYVSGLDADGFWIELAVHTEVNSPEDFAQGYQEAFTAKGIYSTIENITSVDELYDHKPF